MFRIIEKEHFSANVVKLVVEAPLVARSRRAGHFVIVRTGEGGERIPLTIADADVQAGTITLVVQAVGVSTRKICALEPGDELTDVVGPLGKATHIEKVGTVVCAGGGVGVAPLLPIIKAMKQAGNRVITVLAARSADLVILENQVEPWSDEVIVMTDDGSRGRKGLVTAGVEEGRPRSHYRAGCDDEIRVAPHRPLFHPHHVFAQHHYGRWHRHVRRLPCDGRRQDSLRVCRRA